jgi:hypothetical protein
MKWKNLVIFIKIRNITNLSCPHPYFFSLEQAYPLSAFLAHKLPVMVLVDATHLLL